MWTTGPLGHTVQENRLPVDNPEVSVLFCRETSPYAAVCTAAGLDRNDEGTSMYVTSRMLRNACKELEADTEGSLSQLSPRDVNNSLQYWFRINSSQYIPRYHYRVVGILDTMSYRNKIIQAYRHRYGL